MRKTYMNKGLICMLHGIFREWVDRWLGEEKLRKNELKSKQKQRNPWKILLSIDMESRSVKRWCMEHENINKIKQIIKALRELTWAYRFKTRICRANTITIWIKRTIVDLHYTLIPRDRSAIINMQEQMVDTKRWK